jgi:hypothetical protein
MQAELKKKYMKSLLTVRESLAETNEDKRNEVRDDLQSYHVISDILLEQ